MRRVTKLDRVTAAAVNPGDYSSHELGLFGSCAGYIEGLYLSAAGSFSRLIKRILCDFGFMLTESKGTRNII